jgi:hypothetical protein
MTDLPYKIDLWMDDACTRIEEPLATASDLDLARTAYNRAVLKRPSRMITLRNRTMVIAQSREPPRGPDDKVVPIRHMGPVFMDTDDDVGR